MTYAEHPTLLGPEIERCPDCQTPLQRDDRSTFCPHCMRVGDVEAATS